VTESALLVRSLGACFAIAAVLVAVNVVAQALRRSRFAPRADRLVRVVETTSLPNATSLHVVRIADRYVVLSCTNAAIAHLADLPREAVDAWLARGERAHAHRARR
jgi:flagellar biogenesis protein FliO